jgi:hypothetical protein
VVGGGGGGGVDPSIPRRAKSSFSSSVRLSGSALSIPSFFSLISQRKRRDIYSTLPIWRLL